jgi:5'-3' exonuclease
MKESISAMSDEKKKLLLVDGHSILNRAFYGMPDLTNAKGLHTGAVYGFLNILFSQLDELKPDYLTVAFDVHAPTFRHEKYADYKGTRKSMPEELREQVPLMKKMLSAMGIEIREQAGLEADDILGTLAKKAEAQGMEVVLLSGDRDLLQIATDHICIRIPKTRQGQTVIENYYAKDVLETYKVTPTAFIDVKALMGDSSDNVPGVPKVGEKTATQLIVDYGSVDGVYSHLEEIKKPALKKNLSENMKRLGLENYLLMGEGDEKLEIQKERSVMEDLFESIIGAVYIDSGNSIEAVMTSVGVMLDMSVYLDKSSTPAIQSYKNLLQEWCADKRRRLPPPRYEKLAEDGPDHNKRYLCGCYVNGELMGKGEARSVKGAEAAAAEEAYLRIIGKS